MKGKISTISLSAIILCLIIIITKAFIDFYVNAIICENLIILNYLEYDVIGDYFYRNYISLMKIDTIGLTIAILAASVLISVAFYIKLISTVASTHKYKQTFISVFSVINGLAVVSAMMIIFTEVTIFYTILKYSIFAILIMIIIDTIYSYLKHKKSITKFLKSIATTVAIALLAVGINTHFKDINNLIDSNNAIIDYQYNLATDYYNSISTDEEYIQLMVAKHMIIFEELHSNKGLLIGTNSVTVGAFNFVLENDGNSMLFTPLTEQEIELYTNLTQEMTFNIPLLISLFIALIALFLGTLVQQEVKEEYERIITDLLAQLEDYQIKLSNNEITQSEYESLKSLLFEKY